MAIEPSNKYPRTYYRNWDENDETVVYGYDYDPIFTLEETGFEAPTGKQFVNWFWYGHERYVEPGLSIPDNVTLLATWEDIPTHDVSIIYNGASIASLDESGTKTLQTEGKYCSDDIVVEYTKPSPVLQAKTVSPTESEQTVTPDEGSDGLSSVTVNAMALQTKTITPTTSQQTATADTGFDALKTVTVDAISPTKSAQTYTPGTTNQVIESDRWLTGDQTILGDANLVPENIKKDVSIFGVTGTCESSTPSTTMVTITVEKDESVFTWYIPNSATTEDYTDAETGRARTRIIIPTNSMFVLIQSGPLEPMTTLNVDGMTYVNKSYSRAYVYIFYVGNTDGSVLLTGM